MGYEIVERLREIGFRHESLIVSQSDDVHAAADMLEFFFNQMQMHSPKMDGQHSYRFRGGWPMTHAKGNSPEIAIRAAMAEVRRSKEEMT